MVIRFTFRIKGYIGDGGDNGRQNDQGFFKLKELKCENNLMNCKYFFLG